MFIGTTKLTIVYAATHIPLEAFGETGGRPRVSI